MPAQAVFGLLAQVTQQAAPVGMVLAVQAATGSLALAGLVVAAFAAGIAVARPVQGHQIDRRGNRPVLLASGALHVGALLGLVAGAGAGAPGWLLVALGLGAGAGLPPVSTSMRIAWAQRAPAESRTTAYSLAYLIQELAVMVGPLVLSAAVVVFSAAAGLVGLAILAGAGTVAFAAALHRTGRPAHPAAGRSGVLRNRGMRTLLLAVVLLGGAIGALVVGLPALAATRGTPAAGGLLIAAVSFGGVAGALLYSVRHWSTHPASRLVGLLLALGALLAPLVAVGSLPAIGAILLAAGAAVNPALTTMSLLVDQLVPAAPAAGFGWMSTALGAGVAGGSAAAGVVAEYLGAAWSFPVAAAFALGAAATAVILRQTVVR